MRLYYGTTLKRWNRIQRAGLDPRSERRLLLTGNVALAYYRAKNRAALENDDGVIIEVDIDCAKIQTFRERKAFVVIRKKIKPECVRQFGPTIRV